MSVCIVGSGQLSGGLLFLCLKEMHCLEKKRRASDTGTKKREERHWSAAVFPFFVLFVRFHLAFLPGLYSLRSGVRWPRASKQQRAVNSLFTTIPDEPHQRRETLWFLLAFLLFLFILFVLFPECQSEEYTVDDGTLTTGAWNPTGAMGHTGSVYRQFVCAYLCWEERPLVSTVVWGTFQNIFEILKDHIVSCVQMEMTKICPTLFLFSCASTQIFLLFTVETSGLSVIQNVLVLKKKSGQRVDVHFSNTSVDRVSDPSIWQWKESKHLPHTLNNTLK